MKSVFIDTSGWIALLSRDDRMHEQALARYDDMVQTGSRLFTNNYVVDETATLLRYRLGLSTALDFHQMLWNAVDARRLRVVWVDEKSESEAWSLLDQYRDVRLSLTDAACAVTARKARINEVFGCDSDFEAMGFIVVPGSR